MHNIIKLRSLPTNPSAPKGWVWAYKTLHSAFAKGNGVASCVWVLDSLEVIDAYTKSIENSVSKFLQLTWSHHTSKCQARFRNSQIPAQSFHFSSLLVFCRFAWAVVSTKCWCKSLCLIPCANTKDYPWIYMQRQTLQSHENLSDTSCISPGQIWILSYFCK